MSQTMTIREQINGLTSPVARELLGNLADALEDAIFIPNSYLPERFHNHKESVVGCIAPREKGRSQKIRGRSVRSINRSRQFKVCERRAKRNDFKAAKATNVEKYSANPSSIAYDVDDDRLYNAQLRFAKVLCKYGIISFED